MCVGPWRSMDVVALTSPVPRRTQEGINDL